LPHGHGVATPCGSFLKRGLLRPKFPTRSANATVTGFLVLMSAMSRLMMIDRDPRALQELLNIKKRQACWLDSTCHSG
jgi:hypothetical protein